MPSFDDLAAFFQKGAFADDSEREALMQGVIDVALPAGQRRTPVRSGELQRSEYGAVERGGFHGWLKSDVIYGPFVHWGTRRQKAQPFFVEGLDDSRAQIADTLISAGNAYLAKIGKL